MDVNSTIALNDRLAGLTQEELLTLAALAATKAGATVLKGNTEDSTSTEDAPDDLPNAPEDAKEATDPGTLSDGTSDSPQEDTGQPEEDDSTEDTNPADVSEEEDSEEDVSEEGSTPEPTEQPDDAPQEESDTETPTNDHDATETSEESGEDTSTAEDGTDEEGGEEEPQDDANGEASEESGEDSGPECTPEVKTEDSTEEDTSTPEEDSTEDTETPQEDNDATEAPQTPPDAPQGPEEEPTTPEPPAPPKQQQNPFTPPRKITEPLKEHRRANPQKAEECRTALSSTANPYNVLDNRIPDENDTASPIILSAGEMLAHELRQALTLPPSVKDKNLRGLTTGDLDEDALADAHGMQLPDCFMLQDREQSAKIKLVLAVDRSDSMDDSGDIHTVNALIHALRLIFAGTSIDLAVYAWSYAEAIYQGSSWDGMQGNSASIFTYGGTRLGHGVRDIIAHAAMQDTGEEYTCQIMAILTDGDTRPYHTSYNYFDNAELGEGLTRYAQENGYLLTAVGFTGVTQQFRDMFTEELSCTCPTAAHVPAIIGGWLSNLVQSLS